MKQSLSTYSQPRAQKCLLFRAIWFLVFKPLVASWIPGTYWRKFVLSCFGAHFGKHGCIKPYLCISYPWNLKVGDFCWLGESLWIDCLAPVTVGDHVCLSQGVYLCTGNHDFKRPSFDLRLEPIVIGAESWVGAKSILAPGSLIGQGSVICLGSVVSGAVEPFAIVRGNPATRVGTR